MDRGPHEPDRPNGTPFGDQLRELRGSKALDARPERRVRVGRHLGLHADQPLDDLDGRQLDALEQHLPRQQGSIELAAREDPAGTPWRRTVGDGLGTLGATPRTVVRGRTDSGQRRDGSDGLASFDFLAELNWLAVIVGAVMLLRARRAVVRAGLPRPSLAARRSAGSPGAHPAGDEDHDLRDPRPAYLVMAIAVGSAGGRDRHRHARRGHRPGAQSSASASRSCTRWSTRPSTRTSRSRGPGSRSTARYHALGILIVAIIVAVWR